MKIKQACPTPAICLKAPSCHENTKQCFADSHKPLSLIKALKMELLDSLAVANWFIDTAKANGQLITAMKLQKLVYFAHGWHLALYNKALVNEKVEAWRWGPVFRDIYDAAKQFGSAPIVSRLSSFNEQPIVQESDSRIPLLQRIWAVYGKYSASQLSKMTHEENGPWDLTWKTDPGRRNMDIEDETIKMAFKMKIKTHSQE